jgi:hypothetical protein
MSTELRNYKNWRRKHGKHAMPPQPNSFTWWSLWLAEVPMTAREIIRKVLVFMLALLTAFAIMVLVFLPFAFLIWWIIQYMAKQ